MLNNLFGKKDSAPGREPAWVAVMNDNRNRWFVFLDKMEEKMNELGEASIPELKEAYAQESGPIKNVHWRMLNGLIGQYRQMLEKARTVEEEKIHDFYEQVSDEIEFGGRYYELLEQFRSDCADRFNRFEKLEHDWIARLQATGANDPEQEYREILEEYERIKDKFQCRECGAGITIEKIYFIATYIPCPYCQTQNTFEPGSRARMLEHIGRELAEKRCAPLLDAYNAAQEKERELYHRIHELKLGSIGAGRAEERKAEEIIATLEQERRKLIAGTPDLYRRYLRAMFDEWNSIVPDLREQNEKFYQRMLQDFNATS